MKTVPEEKLIFSTINNFMRQCLCCRYYEACKKKKHLLKLDNTGLCVNLRTFNDCSKCRITNCEVKVVLNQKYMIEG